MNEFLKKIDTIRFVAPWSIFRIFWDFIIFLNSNLNLGRGRVWERHGRSPVPDNTTEMLICPGWETLIVPVFQPGTPGRDKRGYFCPGSGNRDKKLLSRLVTPTGTKGRSLLSRLPDSGQKDPLLSRPGVPGWETRTTRVSQLGQISLTKHVFCYICVCVTFSEPNGTLI